jgi:hypothetical protein
MKQNSIWNQLEEIVGTEWIRFEEHHLWCLIRTNQRILLSSGSCCPTLELINIKVDHRHRDQGHFTRFLSIVENYCNDRCLILYIENVMTDRKNRFIEFFAKRGYCVDYESDDSISFFM